MSNAKTKQEAKVVLQETGFENLVAYEPPMDLLSWQAALAKANEAALKYDDDADGKFHRQARDASARMKFVSERQWSSFGILAEKPTLSPDGVYFEIHNDLYDPKADEQVEGAVRLCKLLDKRGNSYNTLLQQLIEAFVKAEINGQSVIVSTSAFGKWQNGKWFDSAIVTVI